MTGKRKHAEITKMCCDYCGACAEFLIGSITEREWIAAHGPYCRHAPRDTRPHSRACGAQQHDHGPVCHPNCPTCGGVG